MATSTTTVVIGATRNLTQRFITVRNEAKRTNANAGGGDRCASVVDWTEQLARTSCTCPRMGPGPTPRMGPRHRSWLCRVLCNVLHGVIHPHTNTLVTPTPTLWSPQPRLCCRAAERLLTAALGGDVEMGAAAAAFAPAWVQKSERLRGDMGQLKERLTKLKEWVAWGQCLGAAATAMRAERGGWGPPLLAPASTHA